MKKATSQISIFDMLEQPVFNNSYKCPFEYMGNLPIDKLFSFYNTLNKQDHGTNRDDICTPMECVKLMIDYVPNELWSRPNIKILDPCCGNGNFGAYCATKTNISNIYFNDTNPIRIQNCLSLLKPLHWRIGDAFALDGDFNTTYDLIMANPPYSGGGNKNQSLSNQFIELAIDRLNIGGYLCFVTPNNWMTYNNKNTTLSKLLNKGSFIVIDNDVKKYFPGIGSSFTIFIWQKGVLFNKTKVINNYLIKDIQLDVLIPNTLKFIPLYLSQTVISIMDKTISKEKNKFEYRCDLHNFTQKKHLSDVQDNTYLYRTIHTARKTRFADIKQDIYDKWLVIIPLSTYYSPYIEHNVNTTQSVGYISFNTKKEAEQYLKKITLNHYKLIVHLTRYGNFNNIMVLKHLDFDKDIEFNTDEINKIDELTKKIKY